MAQSFYFFHVIWPLLVYSVSLYMGLAVHGFVRLYGRLAVNSVKIPQKGTHSFKISENKVTMLRGT